MNEINIRDFKGLEKGSIRDFIKKHFKHFNASVVCDVAQGWVDHLEGGDKMFVAMAGAMSTAEIGISLAEMIRQDKVHAISTTGANVEEDLFNLVAHESYKKIKDYRSLNSSDEIDLRDQGLNRVTDTCIPEEEAMRKLERHFLRLWQKADQQGERFFHFDYVRQLIESGALECDYEIDPKNSWVIAACERNIPVYTPGWEDSTLGNMFVANVLNGNLSRFDIVMSGPEQMANLVNWYSQNTRHRSVGFFQIGGGIAGDFPICVVPLMIQDLKQSEVKLWSYFAQISDSTTSFGSYSGASPNEKISWYKLDPEAPRFIIESDATIVAPLIFSFVLND